MAQDGFPPVPTYPPPQPTLPVAPNPIVEKPPDQLAAAANNPRYKEIITLEVNGQLHTDWTSVRVEQQVTEYAPTFMFETTEDSPMPLKMMERQFKPGDLVKVYVGGWLASNGHITERHTAYDAKQHGVRLIGVGDSFDVTKSTVPLKVVEANHDGKNLRQIVDAVVAHLHLKVAEFGEVDTMQFERVGIQPGELISAVIERHARMRNVVVGSKFSGGLLLIGENDVIPSGDLVEGVNILRANAVLRDIPKAQKYLTISQRPGSSNGTGGAVQGTLKVEKPGTHTRPTEKLNVAEIGGTQHDLERRTLMEQVFSEGAELEARITVQGFFKDNNKSGNIWRAGEYYGVNAPMLMLPGLVLGCKDCIYEQSDAGSTTTLVMVTPRHMNGLYSYREAQKYDDMLRQAGPTGPGGPAASGGRIEGPGGP